MSLPVVESGLPSNTKVAVLCDNPLTKNQLDLFGCVATVHQWWRHDSVVEIAT